MPPVNLVQFIRHPALVSFGYPPAPFVRNCPGSFVTDSLVSDELTVSYRERVRAQGKELNISFSSTLGYMCRVPGSAHGCWCTSFHLACGRLRPMPTVTCNSAVHASARERASTIYTNAGLLCGWLTARLTASVRPPYDCTGTVQYVYIHMCIIQWHVGATYASCMFYVPPCHGKCMPCSTYLAAAPFRDRYDSDLEIFGFNTFENSPRAE